MDGEEVKKPYTRGAAVLRILKSSAVLLVALAAAGITCIFVPPDAQYAGYFDLRTLAYEVGLLSDVPMKTQPKETKQKLHPLEDVPDLLGVSISFVRSLAQNDLVRIIKSPKNRELIDGSDFEIIRFCDELSRFHIEPRNLRQYVVSANRESTMFEQVLVGMLGIDVFWHIERSPVLETLRQGFFEV